MGDDPVVIGHFKISAHKRPEYAITSTGAYTQDYGGVPPNSVIGNNTFFNFADGGTRAA